MHHKLRDDPPVTPLGDRFLQVFLSHPLSIMVSRPGFVTRNLANKKHQDLK